MTQATLVSGNLRRLGRLTAAAAIDTGENLELDANGDVQPHATSTGPSYGPMIAVESSETGLAVEDSYAADEEVPVAVPEPGSVVQMMVADGLDIDGTDFLASDGSGALTTYGGQSVDEGGTDTYSVYEGDVIVGVPHGSIDTTGESDPTLQEVRIL